MASNMRKDEMTQLDFMRVAYKRWEDKAINLEAKVRTMERQSKKTEKNFKKQLDRLKVQMAAVEQEKLRAEEECARLDAEVKTAEEALQSAVLDAAEANKVTATIKQRLAFDASQGANVRRYLEAKITELSASTEALNNDLLKERNSNQQLYTTNYMMTNTQMVMAQENAYYKQLLSQLTIVSSPNQAVDLKQQGALIKEMHKNLSMEGIRKMVKEVLAEDSASTHQKLDGLVESVSGLSAVKPAVTPPSPVIYRSERFKMFAVGAVVAILIAIAVRLLFSKTLI